MRNDLIPAGAELLAVALLSRGAMTAPRALVAYRFPHSGESVTHEVNLQTGGRFDGHYSMTAADAVLDFSKRLERDTHYLEGGIPLTAPSWLEASSPSGWAVAETSTEDG